MKQFVSNAFWLISFALMVSLGAVAQQTSGSLQGRVTDSVGQALAGSSVLAVHEPSGTRYTTASNSDGRYVLDNLRVGGPYTVTVSYVGLQTQVREGVTVTLGDALLLNVALAPPAGQLSAVVVRAVRGSRPDAYGAGMNISPAQVQNMPTIARSLTDMTRLIPQGSKDNSFLGTNFRYNNVTIDGAINNDAIGFSPSLGGITGTSGMPGSSTRTNPISLDAIENIQVYLSPYDVSLGNFTGGSINAVTRSGTNTLTGSVYAYGRNGIVTGKEYAGDGTAMPHDFHDYQIGYRFGFPLIKNKLFFFTNEELTRRQDPILLAAGTPGSAPILSLSDARAIHDTVLSRYGFDPGSYGIYDVYSNSNKFFNRVDWNIDANNQLSVRNNTITSQAINLERDQQDFRFGSIAYQQVNDQTSTVAELKTKLTNQVSNSLIVSYGYIHDYRNPSSDPAIPQVQIVGRTPGSTIFFGTDREGAIFNMKQRSIEISDKVTYNLGKHTLTMGTHNELYGITYGFVNSWNGRVDYASVEDFLAANPYRVRGSFNYTNNTRGYILAHPDAVFNINFYSVYFQDENRINDRVKLTYGLRVDDPNMPHKQILSSKTQNAQTDPDAGTTYTYTPLNQITGNYLNRPQLSPRLGFNVDVRGDKRLIIRGGAGLFTGRIPFAWLGYAFYNNGQTFGAYDQNTTSSSPAPFNPGTDPLRYDPKNAIATFAAANGQAVNNPNAGKTQVDAVDNRFVMPKVVRGSVAVDYTDIRQIKYTFEGIFTKTLKDVKFQQVNLLDQPAYYAYDTAQRKQPIFASGAADPHFANAYEMSNTRQGYRWSATAQVSKSFPMGISVMLAYTYGQSMDVSNGIRNSMESNFQLNQSLNPNNPSLANSNFDIRQRIVANIGYAVNEGRNLATHASVFFNAQSGSPFTYGFVNYTIQNTPQQVSLVYIPKQGETINFFQNAIDKNGNPISAQQQAAAFDAYIDKNKYLSSRRGDFTERNAGRTPWNVDADLHLAQDIGIGGGAGHKARQVITFSVDILNLTNLLYKNWGWVYYSPNTYNSTESVGLSPYIPARASGGYPIYQFADPGKPYSVDLLNSRWQMQFGVRYSF